MTHVSPSVQAIGFSAIASGIAQNIIESLTGSAPSFPVLPAAHAANATAVAKPAAATALLETADFGFTGEPELSTDEVTNLSEEDATNFLPEPSLEIAK
ncbi:MAG: hypothetical protein H7249_13095 [Chitinophagaceae bacterium]|nr:hypothetical protein [Oligoflexus sp.]